MTENLKILFSKISDVPQEHRLTELVEQDHYLVNGELKKWHGAMQSVKSPIFLREDDNLKQVEIGSYPLLTEAEALQVLNSAVNAYDGGRGKWPTMSAKERCGYLSVFVERMKDDKELIVKLLMWEIGKSFVDAQKEFDRTIDYIEETVMAMLKLNKDSSKLIKQDGVIGQVRRAPLGVVLCMGPFNYPLNETFTTLIPALIMGNTVIMKPPKLGVLLHSPLLRIFQDVFPAGVINTVYGDGKIVITPLIASGKIDVLAFIGSSKVADILKKQSPNPHRLRSVLGLEAKNPAIILPNADIESAAKECLSGSLGYNGQRCTALKIIFVHRAQSEEFVSKFTKLVEGLKVGMPWTEKVSITPLPEENKTEVMSELMKDAVDKGARVMNKDGGVSSESLMVPAVIYPVKPNMRLYEEEQFGPLVPIVIYDDVEEVLSYIRQSNYGQQASVFGQDSQLLGSLIDQLVNQVCRVNLNCQCQRGPDIFPFTGRKDSAEGTLSVTDALRVFSIRSMIATTTKAENKDIINDIFEVNGSNFLSLE